MYGHLNPKLAAVLFQRCVRARQIVRMLEEQRRLIAMQGPHSQVVLYCCSVKAASISQAQGVHCCNTVMHYSRLSKSDVDL